MPFVLQPEQQLEEGEYANKRDFIDTSALLSDIIPILKQAPCPLFFASLLPSRTCMARKASTHNRTSNNAYVLTRKKAVDGTLDHVTSPTALRLKLSSLAVNSIEEMSLRRMSIALPFCLLPTCQSGHGMQANPKPQVHMQINFAKYTNQSFSSFPPCAAAPPPEHAFSDPRRLLPGAPRNVCCTPTANWQLAPLAVSAPL